MRLVEHIFKILAPHDCLSCGKEGTYLCNWCVDDAIIGEDERCYRCNKLSRDFATCLACRRKTFIKNLWIRTEYTGIPKELVHKMKFSYSNEAADIIADQLLNTLPSLAPDTLIIHIPTATKHIRQRGFDHALRIAKVISEKTGFERATSLSRTNQVRQVGATRLRRQEQLKGAFRVKDDGLVRNRNILLVDDVVTTGATLEEAATVLHQAGAKSIKAIVFAHSKTL